MSEVGASITARRRIGEYWIFLCWFGKELAPWRRRALSILVCTVLGTTGHLLSFLVVYHYVAALKAHAAIALGPIHIGHATEFHVFLLVASSVLAAMICSSALEYRGRLLSTRLGTEYRLAAERRILVGVSLASAANVPEADGGELVADLMGEARAAEGAVKAVMTGMANLLAVPLGLLVLLYLDPELTALVASLLLVGLAALYRLSLQVAGARRREVAQRRPAQAERRLLGERTSSGLAGIAEDDPELMRYYSSGAVRKAIQASEAQAIALEKSRFAIQVLVALCVISVFLVGGERAVRAGTGWELLIIYLLVLRMLGGKLSGLVRIFTNLNRVYPGLRAYADQMERFRRLPDSASRGSVAQAMGAPSLDGVFGKIKPGDLLGFVTPLNLATRWVLQVARVFPDLHVCELKAGPTSWRAGMRRAFGIGRERSRSDILNQLEFLRVPELQRILPKSLDKSVEDPQTSPLAATLAIGLNLVRQIEQGAQVLLLEDLTLRKIIPAARKPLMDYACTMGVILVVRVAHEKMAASYGIDRLLSSDGHRLVGISGRGDLSSTGDSWPGSRTGAPNAEDVDE